MEILDVNRWEGIVTNSLTTLWDKIAGFAPNVVGAIVILVIGFFLARLLAKLSKLLLTKIGFDRACDKAGINRAIKSAGLNLTGVTFVSTLIFWFIMLLFIISVSETLGLSNVASTVETFVLYLPKVIGAVIIFVIGMMIAGFSRDLIANAAGKIGMEYARPLGSVVYGVLVLVIGMLAIGQLEIDTTLIYNVIQILLLAIGLALALTLGFGTRQISQQLVAGVYARDIFQTGTRVKIGEIEGRIKEVGTVTSEITADNGKSYTIPNHQLIGSVIEHD